MKDLLKFRTDRQRALVAKLRRKGHDYKAAEAVLLSFERTRNAISSLRELQAHTPGMAQRVDARWRALRVGSDPADVSAAERDRINADDERMAVAFALREAIRDFREVVDGLDDTAARDDLTAEILWCEAQLRSTADHGH